MPVEHLELEQAAGPSCSVDRRARIRLDEVSREIVKSKKVIVVSGAGISCSSGIPDFRSENGLYSLVKKRHPDTFVTGKDLFSAGLFHNPDTTSVFLTFAAELADVCQKAQPTRTHHFIQKLDRTGKLLRSYTQNVDGFERRLGMESGGRGKGYSKKFTKNVELHGDLGRMRCVLCSTDFPAKPEWMEDFKQGSMPECPACEEKCKQRINRGARKLTVGVLRPAIVLYDESHPLGDAIGDLQTYDLGRSPEILLIMGTSLKVSGLKQLVKSFARNIHDNPNPKHKGLVVFVNATKPGKEWDGIIDVHIQGESDRWVERVEEEWRRVKAADWEVQTTLDGPMLASGTEIEKVTQGKPSGMTKGKGKGRPKSKSKGKENQTLFTAGQLPTPRPSLSPSKRESPDALDPREVPCSPSRHAKDQDDSYFILSPPASPTGASPPVSPSKRQANVHTPLLPSSPAKKTRAPLTGIASTPGKGNLFAPMEDKGYLFARNENGNGNDAEHSAADDAMWEDVVTLGKSGVIPWNARHRHKGTTRARNTVRPVSTRSKTPEADQENTPLEPSKSRPVRTIKDTVSVRSSATDKRAVGKVAR